MLRDIPSLLCEKPLNMHTLSGMQSLPQYIYQRAEATPEHPVADSLTAMESPYLTPSVASLDLCLSCTLASA